MTVAVCTTCGDLKIGAWCSCPGCGSEGQDPDLDILLSDHNLNEEELTAVGNAVRLIRQCDLDDEMKYHLLVFFLSRKWPKLLAFDEEDADPSLLRQLDMIYASTLAHLPGQRDPALQVSVVEQGRWAHGSPRYETEEQQWQNEVRRAVLEGARIAERIVDLKVRAGEGAVLQRGKHFLKRLMYGADYKALAAAAAVLTEDSKAYRRTVGDLWSLS